MPSLPLNRLCDVSEPWLCKSDSLPESIRKRFGAGGTSVKVVFLGQNFFARAKNLLIFLDI